MKIYVEGSSVFKDRSGVGQYTKRLIEAAARLDPGSRFTFFGFKFWSRPLPAQDIKAPNISYRFVRWMPGRVYNMLFRLGVALPVDLFLLRRPDVILYPNFLRWPVLNRKTKTAVVIHDLSFIQFPQFAAPINRQDNLRFVPSSIAKADFIIAVSESSKRQIVDHYKTSSDKVKVITPAIDHKEYYPRPADEIAAIRRKLSLPENYLLYVGNLEPRKNIKGILEAYAGLDKKLKQSYGLVLAGGRGYGRQDGQIQAKIKELQAAGEDIVTTGYVPDADLPVIFSGASLFVYPSFYEGFGMPPLEAMACGVPVITADNTSLPEVVGDAAIKIKAEDTAGLTEAVAKVLSDPELAAELCAKGLAQAQKFSWQTSAQKLMELSEKL